MRVLLPAYYSKILIDRSIHCTGSLLALGTNQEWKADLR